MAKSSSPYYPPRARWYGVFFDLGHLLRRRLTLDRIHLESHVPFRRMLAGLLVPGVGFWLRGQRPWAAFVPGLCALLVMVFLVWLGYPVGNVAFGLLLSVHATGFVLLCEPWLAGVRFRSRMLFSLAVLFFVGALFYMPARAFVQSHWFMPLQLNGRVIVVHPMSLPADLRRSLVYRGDWIAYSIRERYSRGVSVQGGVGFGPVLALPADQLHFTPDALEVNGAPRARRPDMPVAGAWTVPEKHWFVWPELGIGGHGMPRADLSATLLEMGTISEEQFIGKPFKRWFWRRQVLL